MEKRTGNLASTYIRVQQKHFREYPDCPTIINDFLKHLVVIEGLTLNTTNSYYQHLRTFLRYLKITGENFVLDESAPNLKVSDIKDYFVSNPEEFRKIAISDMKDADLMLVTNEVVTDFLYFCAASGDIESTRSAKLSAIKEFYNYACVNHPDIYAENPATHISRPSLPKLLPKYLNADEAQLLLDAAKDSVFPKRNYCIVALFIFCGLRVTELISIDIKNIGEDTIKIKGKGNKERTIYLNDICIDAINDWMEERATLHPLLDQQALFVSYQYKRRITQRTVQRTVKQILKSAGLDSEGFTPHKLRHTCASLLYKGGADILEIQHILGHEHTTTTEIYTHLDNDRLRNVINKKHPLNKK